MLVDADVKLWSIDLLLTYHAATKIRTVIWDYCGERIPKKLLNAVGRLGRQLSDPQGKLKELVDLLLPEEVEAFEKRVEWVLNDRVYPGLPGKTRRRRG